MRNGVAGETEAHAVGLLIDGECARLQETQSVVGEQLGVQAGPHSKRCRMVRLKADTTSVRHMVPDFLTAEASAKAVSRTKREPIASLQRASLETAHADREMRCATAKHRHRVDASFDGQVRTSAFN